MSCAVHLFPICEPYIVAAQGYSHTLLELKGSHSMALVCRCAHVKTYDWDYQQIRSLQLAATALLLFLAEMSSRAPDQGMCLRPETTVWRSSEQFTCRSSHPAATPSPPSSPPRTGNTTRAPRATSGTCSTSARAPSTSASSRPASPSQPSRRSSPSTTPRTPCQVSARSPCDLCVGPPPRTPCSASAHSTRCTSTAYRAASLLHELRPSLEGCTGILHATVCILL